MSLKSAEEHINAISKRSDLNFNGLLEFMESNDIKLDSYAFPSKYSFGIAMATELGISLNDTRIVEFGDISLFHILLHEAGHFLRIKRIGVGQMDDEIGKIDTAEEYMNYLVTEEKVAERFATIMYYKLNNK